MLVYYTKLRAHDGEKKKQERYSVWYVFKITFILNAFLKPNYKNVTVLKCN